MEALAILLRTLEVSQVYQLGTILESRLHERHLSY